MDSLIAAKGELRVALLAGQIVNCPCCKQRCKIYKRKLNATMARGLLWLVRKSGDDRDWVNIQEGPLWLLRTKELPTTGHWGLVEKRPNKDTTKRTSGIWRPTPQGIAFARGEIEVISHVHLYNNVAYDVGHTERIGIIDALGDKFDYQELMRGCVGGADH
jgi:hypothetical protein|tara:strand:- start:329 stop:811 length:483 start_codon:yes stop_codon:yes gene_type:complete